ncbi:MAG: RNA polymerase sigma factor [Acidobacteria bacterium]|nr:RNA polymerase sigma factor [Acidobacteriota bacterium]
MRTYRGEMPLDHWLSRITVNACYDRLRSRRRHPEEPVSQLGEEQSFRLENRPEPEGDNPEERQRRREECEAARALLERLSAAERLVLTLMILEERSVRDIAALTGWSSANVKIRAFRARRKLRKLILPETRKG